MFGVQVYIDDQLCGTIDPLTLSEPYRTFMPREGNGYRVFCEEALTGSSVKIVTTRAPLATDLYESGLTLCDIRVFNTDREDIYGGHFGNMNQKTRNTKYYPLRADVLKPLGETEPGK